MEIPSFSAWLWGRGRLPRKGGGSAARLPRKPILHLPSIFIPWITSSKEVERVSGPIDPTKEAG